MFRPHAISAGRQRCDAGASIPRHLHDAAYAAIVLSGGYEESGMRGRFRARPGDVLLHAAFESHLDRFLPRTTEILNIPVSSPLPAAPCWSGRIDDPDTLVRLAERDCEAACASLFAQLAPMLSGVADWPDLLAHALAKDPDRRLDQWAFEMGLAPETVSRGFKRVYGVTPRRFRAEVRARRALDLMEHKRPVRLAWVAMAAGFADQPHMTRAIRNLTGVAPGAWLRSAGASSRFKT